MATLNIKQVIHELNTNSRKQLENLAIGVALSKFETEKTDLIENFKEHSVSREIKEGPTAESQYLSKGSLFAALGFFEDKTNPIDKVVDELEDIKIDKRPSNTTIIPSQLTFIYNFDTTAPTLREIKENHQLEWVNRSWIDEVESGISGLGQFVYHLFFKSPDPSRSSTGLQDKRRKNVDTTAYTPPTTFFTKIYTNFLQRIKGGSY